MGRFAPIFSFNCEHFPLRNQKTKTKTKKVRGFLKKNVGDFQNLMTIEFCWKLIFEILILYKPSLGSCGEVCHTIWA